VGMRKRERHAPAQAREQRADRRSRFLPRGDGGKFDLRVLREQAQQLDSRVAGTSNDACLDHVSHLPETKKPPGGGFSIPGTSVPTLNVWSTACAAAPCASRPF